MSTDLAIRRPPPQLRLSSDTSPPQSKDSNISDEDYGCRTPTTAEHKIPAVLTCPAAPRKRRRTEAAACKRKLNFFERVAGEEIDSFFKSNFELVSAKRRCPCT